MDQNNLQHQIDDLNKKVDAILTDMGKKLDYTPSQYTCSDAEETAEEPSLA